MGGQGASFANRQFSFLRPPATIIARCVKAQARNSLLGTRRITNIQLIQWRDYPTSDSRHVGINHCGLEVLMTKQLLYFTDVGASLERMSCE